MSHSNDITTIIEAGNQAPSGDNSQPWRFEVEEQNNQTFIRAVYVTAEKASPFDYAGESSLITLGGVAENMTVAAQHLGYETTLEPSFTNENTPSSVELRISKEEPTSPPDPIRTRAYQGIFERHTNRYPYQKQRVTKDLKAHLETLTKNKIPELQIHFIEDRRQLRAMAWAVSCYEQLFFWNKRLHQGVWRYLHVSKKAAERARDGLDLRTFGLTRFDQFSFRLLQMWPLVRVLHFVGLLWFIRFKMYVRYTKAGAFLIITAPEAKHPNAFELGRALEHLWIELNLLGCAAQPQYAVGLLHQACDVGETEIYSPRQLRCLQKNYARIQDLGTRVTSETRVVRFVLRVGTPVHPTPRSLRRTPTVRYIAATE